MAVLSVAVRQLHLKAVEGATLCQPKDINTAVTSRNYILTQSMVWQPKDINMALSSGNDILRQFRLWQSRDDNAAVSCFPPMLLLLLLARRLPLTGSASAEIELLDGKIISSALPRSPQNLGFGHPKEGRCSLSRWVSGPRRGWCFGPWPDVGEFGWAGEESGETVGVGPDVAC